MRTQAKRVRVHNKPRPAALASLAGASADFVEAAVEENAVAGDSCDSAPAATDEPVLTSSSSLMATADEADLPLRLPSRLLSFSFGRMLTDSGASAGAGAEPAVPTVCAPGAATAPDECGTANLRGSIVMDLVTLSVL